MPGESELAVFRAIADPTRRRLLEALGEGPLPVSRLAAAFPVSRPAVSKHLRLLREAGLVAEERDGRRRLYRLQPEALAVIRVWLDRLATLGEAARRPARGRKLARRQGAAPAEAAGDWRVW